MSDIYGQSTPQAVQKPRRRWLVTTLSIIGGLIIVVSVVIAGMVGWNLTHPEKQPVIIKPDGMQYKDVQFMSRLDDTVLRGWLLTAGEKRERVVIFAHGYAANRSQESPVMPTAKALYDQGIDSLLFDFRNSGESEGTLTSVGQFEKSDLLSAVEFIKELGYQKIGLVGFSMGASTAIITTVETEDVLALVADSPFADLRTYLKENLPVWSNLPAFPFTPLVLGVTPIFTGMDMAQVRPIEAITRLEDRPVLLIHTEADDKIPASNSQLLYDTLASPNHTLWLTPGTKHIGSYQAVPEEYLERVTQFFQHHLQ